MELLNVFRGMKKSNSDSKLGLGEKLSFRKKTKIPSSNSKSSIVNSPLPPRPYKGSANAKSTRPGKVFENIPENLVFGPSIHSPRRDPDIYDNPKSTELLRVEGNIFNPISFIL